MKRSLIVGTGTIAGVAAVLALNPAGASTNAAGLAGAARNRPAASAGTPDSTSTSSGATTATGSTVDVGYGMVQVQATLDGGRIVDVQALALPQNDGHSARISQQAFPMLVQQALAAQSSQIAGISGASYTSTGFVESLKAALLSVGHAA
jgi:uncharacterized protein with FMN-binding domain